MNVTFVFRNSYVMPKLDLSACEPQANTEMGTFTGKYIEIITNPLWPHSTTVAIILIDGVSFCCRLQKSKSKAER